MTMNELPLYGLRTIYADSHVFFTDFSTKARLELSLEVGDNGFKKIKITLQELEKDETGRSRQKNRIDYYCEPQVLLGSLVAPVLSGRIHKVAAQHLELSLKALKEGKGTVKSVKLFSMNGGTPNKRGPNIAEYREISLERSNIYDSRWNDPDPRNASKARQVRFVLRGLTADGSCLQQGSGRMLIVPNRGDNHASSIMFPLTYQQLEAIAMSIYMELQAYRTSQYVVVDIARELSNISDKIDQLASNKTSEVNSDKQPVSQPTNMAQPVQSTTASNEEQAVEQKPVQSEPVQAAPVISAPVDDFDLSDIEFNDLDDFLKL